MIVHCDLKPSNILIAGDGIPKLLDFGIAKLVNPEQTLWDHDQKTLAGATVMTPEYASPEQLLGETITAATDVYALGVVLYEILAGSRPHDLSTRSPASIVRMICESEASPPSQQDVEQRCRLVGDIDNIVLYALRKEAHSRYHSAQNLAADLECYLNGHPVSATTSTLGYRVTKFVKRHKLGVSLGGLLLFVLVGGIIITTWQWQQVRAQHQRAQQHYREVRDLANSIVFEIANSVAKLPGSTRLRQSLLDQGLRYLLGLTRFGSDDPGLQREIASAYQKLADVQGGSFQRNLGNPNNASKNYRKSLAIWETVAESDPENLPVLFESAKNYRRLATLYGGKGELDRAIEFNKRCIKSLEEGFSGQHFRIKKRLIGCYNAAAHWESAKGNFLIARRYLSKAQLVLGKPIEIDPRSIPFGLRISFARIHEELAEVAANTGDLNGAVRHEQKRLDALLSLPGRRRLSRGFADAYQGLAARLASVGNIKDSLKFYRRSLTFWSKLLNEYPDDVRVQQGLAGVYAQLSKLYTSLASRDDDPRDSREHRRKSCEYYQRSATLLHKMPDPELGFGARHSWLRSPAEFMQVLADECRGIEFERDSHPLSSP